MISLSGVLEAAGEIQQFCARRDWRFCFIGGVAVQRWGEPRFTQDVDLTLLTGFGGEEAFIDAMLGELLPRRDDARQFALTNRVLLLQTKSGIPIDVALGGLPFEERSVQRASSWFWTRGQPLTTCSAEDLVVHKAFAGRDRDWGDIERVLTRQHGRLDLEQVHRELEPLLEWKGTPEVSGRLQCMIALLDRRLKNGP